jgi:hypothetical protein
MIGGLLKSASSLAIVAAAGLVISGVGLSTKTARAADLGGDCCADLEERVADLEATTVRKGNRKVSLTITGDVAYTIMYWNDGLKQDTYIVEDEDIGSGVTFKGEGRVSSDTAIGFYLSLETQLQDNEAVNQFDHTGALNGENGIFFNDYFVYVDSKAAGKLELGHLQDVYHNAPQQYLDGVTGVKNYNGPGDDVFSMILRAHPGTFVAGPGGGNPAPYAFLPSNKNPLPPFHPSLFGLTWGDLQSRFGDSRDNLILYKTPTFYGFQLQADWGGNDTWGVGGFYDQTFGTFEVKAAVGYDSVDAQDPAECAKMENSGLAANCFTNIANQTIMFNSAQCLGAGLALYESGSGLFGQINYSKIYSDVSGRTDPQNWWVKAGWRKKVTAFGETGIYGEYGQTTDFIENGVGSHIWGVGIAQNIDSTATTLYLGYRHHELDDAFNYTDVNGVNQNVFTQSMDSVQGGMVVNF